MMRPILVKIPMMLVLAVALSSCTSVLESHLTDSSPGKAGCSNGKASYYLPKRLMTLTLTGGDLTFGSQPTPVADTHYGPFCLDYQGSIFADDKLSVKVDDATSLLQEVKFNAEDKTSQVAIEFINALGDFTAFSLARDAKTAATPPPITAGPFTVDPFDLPHMREIDEVLSRGGFCVFLDARSDPFVPAESNSLCEGAPPADPDAQTGLQHLDTKSDLRSYQNDGILYRPLLSHKLAIMQKIRGQWVYAKSEYIQLPNASPAFLMHVDRSWIGDSKTAVEFDEGTPYQVALAKQSELNVFVDIPLSVLQVAVSIPLRAISFRRTQLANQESLIKVNAAMIDTLEKYERAQNADMLQGLGITTPGGSAGVAIAAGQADPSVADSLKACLNVHVNDPDPTSTCLGIITKGL